MHCHGFKVLVQVKMQQSVKFINSYPILRITKNNIKVIV